MEHEGYTLAVGRAQGTAVVLDEPLSFWGGVNPDTGVIIDSHHPQVTTSLAGRIVVLPGSRGSSSSSSVLAETIRNGSCPAGLVLSSRDPILAVGAVVARKLYGRAIPLVAVEPQVYEACRAARTIAIVATDDRAAITID